MASIQEHLHLSAIACENVLRLCHDSAVPLAGCLEASGRAVEALQGAENALKIKLAVISAAREKIELVVADCRDRRP